MAIHVTPDGEIIICDGSIAIDAIITKWTVLLLHCDATNGSTSFPDSATAENAPHTVTANGSAQVSTGTKKFGTGSLAVNTGGGTSDYLSTPDSADWTVGTGDYTVELWAYAVTAGDATERTMIKQRSGAGSNTISFQMSYRATSGTLKAAYRVGNTAYGSFESASFSLNAWHHVALVRDGNAVRVFLDGVQASSGSISASIGTGSVNDSSSAVMIGRDPYSATADYWSGYIDEVRISKGIARYTTNFTPPAAPFIPD